MATDVPQLNSAREAVSMHGYLTLDEVETTHHSGADGGRVYVGTWRVLSPAEPAKPVMYFGYALQHGMLSLTCTPPGQPTRTWSVSLGDDQALRSLTDDLRATYELLLPERERALMLRHVATVAVKRRR